MQNFELTLSSPVATSFKATKAANSLDIDAQKKSIHYFKVQADIKTPFNIGIIVGASGSGKTTLAKHIYGENVFKEILDSSKPVIDQFPDDYSYDECAAMLCGVGLTSVPCWIRPAYTLSNGQKARAECALQMARKDSETIVIDEWTSVVDRTVAKVMSHCIQKHARKTNKQIVLLSCHYDVLDWLNPDWIIDANKQSYTNRRSLWQEYKRTEQLNFEIREADKSTWKYFSRYHYLSEKLAGGKQFFYGLWDGNNQIGFLAFSNYVPLRKDTPNAKMKLHFNRLVIHPDYCGFGLGILFLNKCAKIVKDKNYEILGKFSSMPVYNAFIKDKQWKLIDIRRDHKVQTGPKMLRKAFSRVHNKTGGSFRLNVKTWSFRYVGM
jgi:energy-coupling factor transporter ATP-binding protein EcfA2